MIGLLRASVVVTALTVLLLGVAYPALITGIAQLAFHHRANGSLVLRDGRVVGSSLIGQGFAQARYFHPRPSAAGKDGYDASGSSGSNLGPTSKALAKNVAEHRAAIEKLDGPAAGAPPIDLITASASGLDPHISPESARHQVARIVAARPGLDAATVEALIARHVEGRTLGLLGEPRVNVLQLNLALDQIR